MIDNCTLPGHIYICVPSGETVFISCPVHQGGHTLYGSPTVSS